MLRKIKKALLRVLCTGTGTAASGAVHKAFEDGHFYSPVVNLVELKDSEERIWPEQPVVANIDFNEKEQRRWLSDVLSRHLPYYDYPEERRSSMEEYAFYTKNPAFSWLDSRMLFAVLRELRPQRLIEVGSGFSSLLAADVNRRFLGNQLEITCIEPYPRNFLRVGVPGISKLMELPVQQVPMETFEKLEAGDILFIDSSHVSKTGSDVNYIYHHVIPKLQKGVLIHIHDIFLPNDYPKEWLLELGRNWNEQYLVQAILMYSQEFEVLFGSSYVLERIPDLVKQVLGGAVYGGGSLWLRKSSRKAPN